MLTIRYIYFIPSKVVAVCVLKWSIFTNSIKNTALNKRDYFLVRHGGRKKISQVYGLYNSKNISFWNPSTLLPWLFDPH